LAGPGLIGLRHTYPGWGQAQNYDGKVLPPHVPLALPNNAID
jgi:hypothetical protein